MAQRFPEVYPVRMSRRMGQELRQLSRQTDLPTSSLMRLALRTYLNGIRTGNRLAPQIVSAGTVNEDLTDDSHAPRSLSAGN